MPSVWIQEDTHAAIDELGGTFDSPDDVIKRLIREADHGDLLDQGEMATDLTDDEIATRVCDHFGLDDETATADHVIAVVQLIRDGYDLTEAIQQRADEIDVSPSTIRAACTRRIGIEGGDASEQFQSAVDDLLNQI